MVRTIAEFLATLAIYIAVGTAIALVSRRFGVKTSSEYFVAGYRLGGFLSSMTYAATTYSAFMMIGLVGFAYATGVGALGFELAYLLATLALLTVLAPRVWLMARERGWVSPTEMLSDLYGINALGHLVAVLYLVALIPYISAQMIGVGSIFEGLGAGFGTGIAVAAALSLTWVVVAGVWSVASTDAYQGLWMITAALTYVLWVTLFLVPSAGLDIGGVAKAITKAGVSGLGGFWTPTTFAAFTVPWLFFAVTNPQVVQRVFMPANERSLKRLIQYFAIYAITYTLIVTLVGLTARALTEVGVLGYISNRDLVTPTLLLTAHPALASFIYVSIVAAAISTSNSIVLSVTSSFVRDLYERRAKEVRPRRSITLANSVVASLVATSAVVAFLRPGFVVEMSVLSSVILLPLAPVTIAGWVSEGVRGVARYSSLVAVVVGVSTALYSAAAYGPKKAFITTWFGVPISVWVLALSTLIVVAGLLLSRVKPHVGR